MGVDALSLGLALSIKSSGSGTLLRSHFYSELKILRDYNTIYEILHKEMDARLNVGCRLGYLFSTRRFTSESHAIFSSGRSLKWQFYCITGTRDDAGNEARTTLQPHRVLQHHPAQPLPLVPLRDVCPYLPHWQGLILDQQDTVPAVELTHQSAVQLDEQ